MSIRATIAAGLASVGAFMAVPLAATDGDAPEERIWLDAHNVERAEFGVAPLTWSEDLAREAQSWARRLSRLERLEHSTREQRNRTGENLWMGTARRYSPQAMIAAFSSEKQYFRAGEFPRVSTTGNWADVGHYTQIVWSQTRQVGCARAPGARFDILVCRYWPAGNVIGQRIAPANRAEQR